MIVQRMKQLPAVLTGPLIAAAAWFGCADSPEDFEPDENIAQEVDDIEVDGGNTGGNDDTGSGGGDSEPDSEQSQCQNCCPDDESKDSPGVCGCGVPDVDSDGDGSLDCMEDCPDDPNKVLPGICGCGRTDEDTDGDGTVDCEDDCAQDSGKVLPGVCGCGVPDVDSDEDGVLDCRDGCPNDPEKTSPGICGCDVADDDGDGDGVVNCRDKCPNDPLKADPGICGCGNAENSCKRMCLEAEEHQVAILACAEGSFIVEIRFAGFGEPKGSCLSSELSEGLCHSEESLEVVGKECLGKRVCSFEVEKSFLGDPHCGKSSQERLIVEYICRSKIL